MKSSWKRTPGTDHQVPIEMRFIDMFMTTLGSLIFIALLLVFLLPKSALQSATSQSSNPQDSVPRRQLEDTLSQNRQLQSMIDSLQFDLQSARNAQSQSEQTAAGKYDKELVKRAFSILLATEGCQSVEPEMYVRWEGKLINFLDDKPRDYESLPFDASNVGLKMVLVGQKYFDIGYGSEIRKDGLLFAGTAAALEAISKKGLHFKLFQSVSNPGPYSVYMGLALPLLQSSNGCTVYPFYLSSAGLIQDNTVVLTKQRPYALLRRMTMQTNGVLTVLPNTDDSFKNEMEEFSKKQSQLLCDRRSICDTVDANFAALFPDLVQVRQTTAKTSTPAIADPTSPQGPSLWNQGQSIVSLVADGARRRFQYKTPADTLVQIGVKEGALLFEGVKSEGHYSGKAYVYEKGCAPRSYQVKGDVSADEKEVRLRGQAPLMNSSCRVYAHYSEVLVFRFRQP